MGTCRSLRPHGANVKPTSTFLSMGPQERPRKRRQRQRKQRPGNVLQASLRDDSARDLASVRITCSWNSLEGLIHFDAAKGQGPKLIPRLRRKWQRLQRAVAAAAHSKTKAKSESRPGRVLAWLLSSSTKAQDVKRLEKELFLCFLSLCHFLRSQWLRQDSSLACPALEGKP